MVDAGHSMVDGACLASCWCLASKTGLSFACASLARSGTVRRVGPWSCMNSSMSAHDCARPFVLSTIAMMYGVVVTALISDDRQLHQSPGAPLGSKIW